MLLLLIQGRLSNLTVEERFAFNVSLRMFTRSIVIQRRVEDLQLGVESYQKRLNLTKPDTYRPDLKRREVDRTLNDVRNALDDCLKGIRMQYLPHTIWRRGDKDRAAAMIQAINKMLKTRRIMRSLERHSSLNMYYDCGAYVKGELFSDDENCSGCKHFDICIKHRDYIFNVLEGRRLHTDRGLPAPFATADKKEHKAL
nr:hypothetical protein [Tanacetum cinerariifolium]